MSSLAWLRGYPATRRLRITTLLATCALAGACGAESTTTDPDPPVTTEPAELQPAVLPRLTAAQYRNALQELFAPAFVGEALPPTPTQPDTNPFSFVSIGATTDPLSELGTQHLEENADRITHAVFDSETRRTALVGCTPVTAGDACVRGFLAMLGRKAFRRSLKSTELDTWVSLAASLGADSKDVWAGVRLAVAGMLQAPSFVYRIELGEPDPENPEQLRYTDFELASRLAFLLWNSLPDDELLDAAEQGELSDPTLLEEQTRRMLEDPRARAATQEFFAEYLDLGRLDGMTRDPVAYPEFEPSLPEAMRAETTLMVDDLVFRREVDVRELFSTRRTFVNTELATLYGVPADGATRVAFVPIELPENGPRAGFLTSAAFLAMNAHQATTSPTLRGKFIREKILCAEVPPPPPDVSTEIESDPENPRTLREELDQHRSNPACSGCHSVLDPPGYLFESFDAIGAYRTTDNGYPIDTSGELGGEPLANARELADMLLTEPKLGKCIVKQYYRHAQGRLDVKGEAPALEAIHARFEENGFRFKELVVALVLDDSFRYLAPVAAEVSP